MLEWQKATWRKALLRDNHALVFSMPSRCTITTVGTGMLEFKSGANGMNHDRDHVSSWRWVGPSLKGTIFVGCLMVPASATCCENDGHHTWHRKNFTSDKAFLPFQPTCARCVCLVSRSWTMTISHGQRISISIGSQSDDITLFQLTVFDLVTHSQDSVGEESI